MFLASGVKIVQRRFKFDFVFHEVSAVPSEVAGTWYIHGPDLNTGLPRGQQSVFGLLVRAVSSADADQTRERHLPTGSKHGSAIVSSRAKVLFRTQGASVPLRPPGLGPLQRCQGDHWAC